MKDIPIFKDIAVTVNGPNSYNVGPVKYVPYVTAAAILGNLIMQNLLETGELNVIEPEPEPVPEPEATVQIMSHRLVNPEQGE